MKIVEEIEARGHRNIMAKNKKTFELTMDDCLTPYGDCIVAVSASKGAHDLSEDFKRLARVKEAKIKVIVEANGLREAASGYGHPGLEFDHERDLVIRKSSYTCGRTLMVRADKAAFDFSRPLIKCLKSSQQKVHVRIIVDL